MGESENTKETEYFSMSEVERMVEGAEEEIQVLRGYIELDIVDVGVGYGFEQITQLEDPETGDEHWKNLSDRQKTYFLEKVGQLLGLDLLNIGEESIVKHYREEGVKGESTTEEGADVTVLQTKFPELELHIMQYENPEVGTRYDLVRAK